jgi:hypothetical protein
VASPVTGTTLTLKDAYGDIGASGLNFIAAETCELERFAPGRFAFAPVHLALRRWFLHIGDNAAAQNHQDLAEEDMAQADNEELAWEEADHPVAETSYWTRQCW